MIILIRKKRAAALLLAVVALSFVCSSWWHTAHHQTVFLPDALAPKPILIDPGHGGEDGGAVSPSGVAESQINLQISQRLADLLCFTGQQVQLTRQVDRSLDGGEPTIRQRKAADLKARTALAGQAALLLSIHQNSLPSSPVTHGAQAFWNSREGADILAEEIQSNLNAVINTHRPKEARQISSSVYLMRHIAVPGVLIECGFLSNSEETELLQQPSHQKKIALSVAAGCLRRFSW